MTRHRAISDVALLALTVSCLACQVKTDEPAPRPNVILISIDTLRPDHLGSYGYSRPTSPFLDSLAERGVRFENAFAQTSWTLPSHMSMLTSRYPHDHNVVNHNDSLPEGIPTLAEVFDAAGYDTAAFVNWVFLAEKFGFGRGFDKFVEILPPEEVRENTKGWELRADTVSETVSAWARDETPTKPFFLFVHFFDPHQDYDPPLEHARLFAPDIESTADGANEALRPYIRGVGRRDVIPDAMFERATALYDGEIHFTDSEIEKMFAQFDKLGLLEDTVVLVTSDHGEEFLEHDSMEGHGWTLYDEVLHVPLILYLPGDAYSGAAPKVTVQSIDIAPTLLAAADIEPPDSFSGRDLLPVLNDGLAEEKVYASLRRHGQKRSVRDGRYKLIHTTIDKKQRRPAPQWELFDLATDPTEQRNIVVSHKAISGRLQAELLKWKLSRKEPPTKPPPVELSPEERERLKSLGYLQ